MSAPWHSTMDDPPADGSEGRRALVHWCIGAPYPCQEHEGELRQVRKGGWYVHGDPKDAAHRIELPVVGEHDNTTGWWRYNDEPT